VAFSLYVTSGCNLNCRYCFNWENAIPTAHHQLDYSTIQEILRAGRAGGHRYLTLTGGEPFIHPEISRIIATAHELGYWITILTNGILVTDAMLAALAAIPQIRIRVSLEGATAGTHEYFRGPNTFSKAIGNIQKLIRAGIWVGIGFTVYDENMHEIPAMIQLASELGCFFVRFSPVVRIMKGKQALSNVALYEKALLSILQTQLQMRDKLLLPIAEQAQFSLPMEALTTKQCEAGCNFFAINPEKIILPCPLIRSIPTVFRKQFEGKDDFRIVAQAMEKFFAELRPKLRGVCGHCEHKTTCSSGCLAEKLSFDLAVEDEQPICMKRMIAKLSQQFSVDDFELLQKAWTSQLSYSMEDRRDIGKICYRQSPLWSVWLKAPGSQRRG